MRAQINVKLSTGWLEGRLLQKMAKRLCGTYLTASSQTDPSPLPLSCSDTRGWVRAFNSWFSKYSAVFRTETRLNTHSVILQTERSLFDPEHNDTLKVKSLGDNITCLVLGALELAAWNFGLCGASLVKNTRWRYRWCRSIGSPVSPHTHSV